MTALGGVCCFAPYALAEIVAAKDKGPEVDSLGAFIRVCTDYFAAGTAKAALAALAALFFARLTLAQRLC